MAQDDQLQPLQRSQYTGTLDDQTTETYQRLKNAGGTAIRSAGVLPGITRLGGGILASEGGLPGAGIAGAAEVIAQMLEKGTIDPRQLDYTRVGVESGLGAIPFGKVFSGAKAAAAAKSTLASAIGIAGHKIEEGKPVLDPASYDAGDALNLGIGAGMGAVFGGHPPVHEATVPNAAGTDYTTTPVVQSRGAVPNPVSERPGGFFEKPSRPEDQGFVDASGNKQPATKRTSSIQSTPSVAPEPTALDLAKRIAEADDKTTGAPPLSAYEKGLINKALTEEAAFQKGRQKPITSAIQARELADRNRNIVNGVPGVVPARDKPDLAVNAEIVKNDARLDKAAEKEQANQDALDKIEAAREGLVPGKISTRDSVSGVDENGVRQSMSQPFVAPKKAEAGTKGGPTPTVPTPPTPSAKPSRGRPKTFADYQAAVNAIVNKAEGIAPPPAPVKPPTQTAVAPDKYDPAAAAASSDARVAAAAATLPPLTPDVATAGAPPAPEHPRVTFLKQILSDVGPDHHVAPYITKELEAAQRYEAAQAAANADPNNQELQLAARMAGTEASGRKKFTDSALELNGIKYKVPVGAVKPATTPVEAAPAAPPADVAPAVLEDNPQVAGAPPFGPQPAAPGWQQTEAARAKAGIVKKALASIGANAPDALKELEGLTGKARKSKIAELVQRFVTEKKAEVDPATALKLASAGGGALLGYLTDPLGDPTTSAVAGGVGGLGISHGIMNTDPREAAAFAEALQSKLGELYKRYPNYQRFSLLSNPTSLMTNMWAGPYGSGLMAALEYSLSGDPAAKQKGLAALKELANPVNFAKGWMGANQTGEAAEAIGRAEGENFSRLKKYSPQWFMALPGEGMTAGDIAVRDILKRAGFSDEEARAITLTSEPEKALFRTISQWGKKKGVDGERSTFANIMLPFKRTTSNIVEQGMQRLPGVGLFVKSTSTAPRGLQAEIARQGLGMAVAYTSYEMGKRFSAGDKNSLYVRRFLSNLAGQYALNADLGFAYGQAVASGNPHPALAAAKNAGQGLPLPTLNTPMSWLNTIANYDQFNPRDISKYPGAIVPNFIKTFNDDPLTGLIQKGLGMQGSGDGLEGLQR